MKFFFKTLLPYIILFFVNMYGVRYAFEGMTAPHDLTFIGGIVLLAFLAVVDVSFIRWQIKRIIRHYDEAAAKLQSKEESNEQA